LFTRQFLAASDHLQGRRKWPHAKTLSSPKKGSISLRALRLGVRIFVFLSLKTLDSTESIDSVNNGHFRML